MTRLWLAALLLGLPVGPAWAHAVLIESTPAAQSSVPSGATAIRLRFNSRIDGVRSRVTLAGPAGAQTTLIPAAGAPPNEIDGPVTLDPGAWVLRWQVLAIDGHITRGVVPFRVVPAP